MFRFASCLMLLPVLSLTAAEPEPAKKSPGRTVAAIVESSLATGRNQIRQFAFDANPDTAYVSDQAATQKDSFTLTFDEPVLIKSIRVTTGNPKGEHKLNLAVLEVSADGKTFTESAKFDDGSAAGSPMGKVKVVRIQPTEDLPHPLAIREIELDSDPVVAVFKYPIEFVIDVTDAPEMKDWIEQTVRVCEQQYRMICDELMSEGFKPLTVIRMTLKNDYNGVAAAGGGRITGSVKYFKANPRDVGAMVHETVHCVQLYRSRGNPGWLVEGVADYIRFFKYEKTKPRPLSPERANYDGSYRTTAAFLAFLTDKYDPLIVKKLNAAMRDGKYKPELWKELTGKRVEELGREWQQSLAK